MTFGTTGIDAQSSRLIAHPPASHNSAGGSSGFRPSGVIVGARRGAQCPGPGAFETLFAGQWELALTVFPTRDDVRHSSGPGVERAPDPGRNDAAPANRRGRVASSSGWAVLPLSCA